MKFIRAYLFYFLRQVSCKLGKLATESSCTCTCTAHVLYLYECTCVCVLYTFMYCTHVCTVLTRTHAWLYDLLFCLVHVFLWIPQAFFWQATLQYLTKRHLWQRFNDRTGNRSWQLLQGCIFWCSSTASVIRPLVCIFCSFLIPTAFAMLSCHQAVPLPEPIPATNSAICDPSNFLW